MLLNFNVMLETCHSVPFIFKSQHTISCWKTNHGSGCCIIGALRFLHHAHGLHTKLHHLHAALPGFFDCMQGLTLDELSDFLAAHTGVSSCHYRSQLPEANVDLFRTMLLKALSLPGMFAIVNFDRSVLLVGSNHHVLLRSV